MTAVVVGANGGIGAACASALRDEGVDVVTADLTDADVTIDLASPQGREAGIAALREACSGGLDRLVMAAGVGPTVADPGLIPSINLFGTLAVADGLLHLLGEADRSTVVLLSSHSASMLPDDDPTVLAYLEGNEAAAVGATAQTDPAVAYAASKRALTTRMRERVSQYADAGVRLNAVAPGPVHTPLLDATLDSEVYGEAARALPVPLQRWAQPEEIAAVVAFLSSPAASIVHGAVWFTDGGTDALIRPGSF